MGIADVHNALNNFFGNKIQEPRNYHAIAAVPSIEKKIVWGRSRNATIDESHLVLCRQPHHHNSTPVIVIASR